ncbi:hypothetical protein HYW68_01195 [Candidatus Parcubacteria bacterium]|nr:hypothetical protein [Candidatus Parcubacteria bacterium]
MTHDLLERETLLADQLEEGAKPEVGTESDSEMEEEGEEEGEEAEGEGEVV